MSGASTIFGKSEMQRLLRAMRNGEMDVIEPVFNHEGVRYPAVEERTGLSSAEETVEPILRDLYEKGILTREVRETFVACPTCGSHSLTVRLRCLTCGSPQLRKGLMIEHLTCGYLDFEEKFQVGRLLVCPKCSKALKAVGVDYRKPGITYNCLSCGGSPPTQTGCAYVMLATHLIGRILGYAGFTRIS